MKVSLIAKTNVDPTDLASHAARICYSSKTPVVGDRINVEDQLFNTGHHTTLAHSSFTFLIDGISISDVTFGLHLFSSFYNADQQSGRYSKMYSDPNLEGVRNYIMDLWPDVDSEKMNDLYANPNLELAKEYIFHLWPKIKERSLKDINIFLTKGLEFYQKNIESATELVAKKLKEERPYIKDEILTRNSSKIAQEQLRVFISTIFPTRLDYTINLVSLVSFYKSAWTPALRIVTQKMADLVLQEHPEIKYMFERDSDQSQYSWSPSILKKGILKLFPEAKVIGINKNFDITFPNNEDKHPIDLMHTHPKFMNNSINQVVSDVELSIMTYGQDQRHRTIRRSQPVISGNFFVPPIVRLLGLENEAQEILDIWYELKDKIPASLAINIAPYGLMVEYQKAGELNAVIHEMEKRLCWCAQQEIYEVALKLYRQIKDKYPELLPIFEPPCFKDKCLEGARYCGRDLSLKNDPEKFFVSRVV